MRIPRDPTWSVWLAGVPVMLLCCAWALWPLDVPEAASSRSIVPAAAADAVSSSEPDAIARNAYTAALWNPLQAPAQQVAPVAGRSPPPALAIELVAIIDDAKGHLAALYDQKTGRTLIVAVGDAVGQFRVGAIEANVVELTDGRVTQRLLLREDVP